MLAVMLPPGAHAHSTRTLAIAMLPGACCDGEALPVGVKPFDWPDPVPVSSSRSVGRAPVLSSVDGFDGGGGAASVVLAAVAGLFGSDVADDPFGELPPEQAATAVHMTSSAAMVMP